MKIKIIPFIVTAIVLCATCTSCFTTMALIAASESSNNISREKTNLNLTIFQTLGKHEALARTNNYDVVKIETVSDVYYDGKQINGNFTLIDTYSYETTKGIIKIVPVYVLTREYNKLKDHWN